MIHSFISVAFSRYANWKSMKAGGSSAFDGIKSMWTKNVPGAGKAELTEEERESLREVFDQIDDDGSGEVRYRSVYCTMVV